MMTKFSAMAAALIMYAGAASAADLPYLYDQLKSPAYRQPLQAILAKHKLPPWIGGFIRGGNGVASPGASVVVDGETYELYNVCEAHNCGGNFLYVLYTPHGGKAWALVTKDDAILTFLGNPTAGQREALVAASKA
jgi:hypothetical protein